MGNTCSRHNDVHPHQEGTPESGDDPQLGWDDYDCSENLVVSFDRSEVCELILIQFKVNANNCLSSDLVLIQCLIIIL